ncbi:hypothetical protein HYW72_01360 [Candidatus Nomurabacteria bacterium]|nr:hypothetical protein [Candidatus Nomurabacteria bacterium]
MPRGKILIKILELLYDQAMNQVDFFSAVLVSGYGASARKIDYEYQKRRRLASKSELDIQDFSNKKLRLQKFLSKLKHDGLIRQTEGVSGRFTISSKGRTKLAELKKKFQNKYYEVEDKKVSPIIISFDVPEEFKRKRAWLRAVIQNLGFEMVHKSVWMGNTKLPKQLILDLEKMNILEFIEIFEITKTGTLKKVDKA